LNFVFVSPQFPKTYWNFCDRLKHNGVNVLGIGDSGYDEIPDELKECLTEYYRVDSMADYDAMVRAMGYFTFKYGKIDWLESNNEFWLEQDASLRTDFNITTGAQNVIKGSNRDRIVAELQTHDLPHGDQQFCCPGVYRKQRHRDSKNRQKFPDSFHFFSPPHVRACLVNMTRAEKHNRCKCRKIRNRMGTLAFFVLILILYLGTSE